MSVFIDYKLGNKMLSGTNFNAIRHGLHKMTLEGREGGVVGEGVNQAGEDKYGSHSCANILGTSAHTADYGSGYL